MDVAPIPAGSRQFLGKQSGKESKMKYGNVTLGQIEAAIKASLL